MSDITAMPLIDKTARDAALDPQRSVVVTAPAGSGKTELLTQRILVLLAQVEEPEDILAITFTRKAAAEMRERLLKNLRAVAMGEQHNLRAEVVVMAQAVLARDANCGWNLLANPQRLRVQTIDSFTGGLIANLPLQSGFGGRPNVQEDAYSLYRDAVRQLFQSLETDVAMASALGNLLQHVDNRFATLETLLVNLLAKRDQWLLLLGTGRDVAEARQYFEHTLQQLIEEKLHDAFIQISPLAGELMSLVDYACQQLRQLDPSAQLLSLNDRSGLPECDADQLQQWQLLYEFLFTQSGELRKEKGITKRNGFPTDKKEVDDVALAKQRKQEMGCLLGEIGSRPELITALKTLAILPAPQFSDQQWHILSALVVLLPRLIAELQLVFARRGEVDFTEQSLAALRAIGDHDESTELRFKMDQRFKHILVDEFQDTSVVQFSLLKSLVAEWDSHNLENPQAPRTLFVVGDGMQSIYGFRAADVGLFLDARQQGIGPVHLDARDLTVNFRSSPVIVDWVNRIFSQLFPQHDNPDLGASHHVHAEAIKTGAGEVVMRGFIDDPASPQKQRQQTTFCIEQIAQIRQQYPDQSIAVLVRAKSHLYPLIEQLIRADIPWQASDIAPLVGRPVVQDLLMLLRALANPADRIAWLALLRSPLCGLTNADLFALVAAPLVTTDSEESVSIELAVDKKNAVDKKLAPISVRLHNSDIINSLSESGRLLVTRLADVLQAAEHYRERKTLRVWLEAIWLGLGGARAYENSDDVTGSDPVWNEAEAFFNLLESKLPHLCDFDLETFVEALARLFVTPLTNTDKSCVQLMTMHKAKGLEFDTVFLPYLDRSTRADDKPLLVWDSYHPQDYAEPQLMLAVKPARGGEADQVYDYLLHKRALRTELEQVRLLYVAVTRAKSRLYLTYGGKHNSKGELSDPPSSSLLARLYPAFQQDELADIWKTSWQQSAIVAFAEKLSPGKNPAANNCLKQLQPDWRSIVVECKLSVGETPQWQDTRLARAVGVAVHKVLELSAQSSQGFWLTLDAEKQERYLNRLLEQELPASLLASAVQKARQQLVKVFADEKACWILDATHQQSSVELPLFVRETSSALTISQRDEFSQLVIDRCFIADGHAWLIDYKTSEPFVDELADESLEAFLLRERNEYLPQLQRYAMALNSLWNLPVKAALYFTAIPYLYEIEL